MVVCNDLRSHHYDNCVKSRVSFYEIFRTFKLSSVSIFIWEMSKHLCCPDEEHIFTYSLTLRNWKTHKNSC